MSISLEQYQIKLQQLIQLSTATVVEQAIVPAANKLLGTIINRVSRKGESSTGSKIGVYSRKPAYFSKDQFIKKGAFKPIGKTGKKTKSTMYLPGGYNEFKAIQGRGSESVNVTYTGDLIASYQLQAIANGVLLGLISETEKNKRIKLEKQYGVKIFQATKQELENYNKEVAKVSNGLISKIFNGTI